MTSILGCVYAACPTLTSKHLSPDPSGCVWPILLQARHRRGEEVKLELVAAKLRSDIQAMTSIAALQLNDAFWAVPLDTARALVLLPSLQDATHFDALG